MRIASFEKSPLEFDIFRIIHFTTVALLPSIDDLVHYISPGLKARPLRLKELFPSAPARTLADSAISVIMNVESYQKILPAQPGSKHPP